MDTTMIEKTDAAEVASVNNWQPGSMLHTQITRTIALSGLFDELNVTTPKAVAKVSAPKVVGKKATKKTGTAKKVAKAPKTPKAPKAPRVIKGKFVVGKANDAKLDFWMQYGIDVAVDDTKLSGAVRKGNYDLTKQFFKTDWAAKEFFTLKEFRLALNTKYAGTDKIGNNGVDFRIQVNEWAYGMFYENTGECAVKPIYKRETRGLYRNIFFVKDGE